jgi:hypothetical protein
LSATAPARALAASGASLETAAALVDITITVGPVEGAV